MHYVQTQAHINSLDHRRFHITRATLCLDLARRRLFYLEERFYKAGKTAIKCLRKDGYNIEAGMLINISFDCDTIVRL